MSSEGSQEIPPCILWKTQVLYRIYNSPPPVPSPRQLWTFFNIIFLNKEFLAHHATLKLEDHPLPAVFDCLFSIFAASLHIGDRSFIRNPRTLYAVVTGTHLSRNWESWAPFTEYVHVYSTFSANFTWRFSLLKLLKQDQYWCMQGNSRFPRM
jgi:hypothetical protein